MKRSLATVEVDGVSVSYDRSHQPAVADVSISIESGTVVALLGPSGCGKTSLLRAIAGLERPTTGSVMIGGRTVSSDDTWVKPEQRHIGMVFQDGALFPHLTVGQNIEFGLRPRRSRMSKAARRARVAELLHLVELNDLADRMPDTLSGGQQQRVALARSLAPNPSVLLLDEPFSALDTGLRVQVRADVARILREVGVTSIFVTHDQDEAFVLGDKVAVMRDGRIEQFGDPDALYRTPRTPWIARFVGEANFIPGRQANGYADTALGCVGVTNGTNQPGDVSVLVRPEQVTLTDGTGAEITAVEYYGHDVRYELLLDDGSRLSARAHPDHLRARGDRVAITFGKSVTTTVFPV